MKNIDSNGNDTIVSGDMKVSWAVTHEKDKDKPITPAVNPTFACPKDEIEEEDRDFSDGHLEISVNSEHSGITVQTAFIDVNLISESETNVVDMRQLKIGVDGHGAESEACIIDENNARFSVISRMANRSDIEPFGIITLEYEGSNKDGLKISYKCIYNEMTI